MMGIGWGRRELMSGARLGRDGREDSCGFAAHLADAGGVLQRAGGLLETEVECFLLEIEEAELEFVSGKLVDGFGFGFGHGSDG